MTGVLNRMVQRAHGRLLAVEPLVKSHQTALAVWPSMREETGERVSSTLEHDLRPHQEIASSSQQGALRDRDAARMGNTDKVMVRRESDREEKIGGDSALERRQNTARSELSLTHEGELPRAKPVGPEMRLQDENEALILEVRTAMPASGVRSQRRSDEPVRQSKTNQEREIESLNAKPEERVHETAGQFEVAAEHTEIHITIGSVEFRAPVPEAPQRAPAFKPRVSLDEFLSGRSGVES